MAKRQTEKVRLTPELVTGTLHEYYSKVPVTVPLVPREETLMLLDSLEPLREDDEFERLNYRLRPLHPGRLLEADDYSQICFIDDCVTELLEQADLDLRIENLIRSLTPALCRVGLEEGIFTVMQSHPLLSIIDQLTRNCIGWNSDLGILGTQFIEEVDSIVHGLVKNKGEFDKALESLKEFFEGDRRRLKSLEEILNDEGMKQLKQGQARRMASTTINTEMQDRKFSLFVVLMLQGPWHDLLHSISMELGPQSRAWQQAVKLTQAIIWTLQPHSEKSRARQAELIETLPGQIHAFLDSLEFDTSDIESSLGDLESDYEKIRAGETPEPSDFEMLTIDSDPSDRYVGAEEEQLEQIANFKPGQWFLFDDAGERIARIKLILKWDDGEQLVFSNQNRRKVLPMRFAELGQHLESGVVKALDFESKCVDVFRNKMFDVIRLHELQKRKVEKVTEVEREHLNEEFTEQRKAERLDALEQVRIHSQEKREREARQQAKIQQKIDAANSLVESLRIDAWLKLPIMEGTLTECRLAAIIASAGKYIFVNRAGLKVAEYSANDLAQSFISEKSEVVDTGAEFEDVLANVVTGLRANKEKSYSELSGEAG